MLILMSMKKTLIQQNNAPISFPFNPKKKEKGFRSVSLVDQIARTLKDKILTGVFKGGEQLLEDRLKDEFEVSRTPLREAFRVLEKEGLVEILPRRGTFVKKITRQDIEQNFPVRAILEGLAARLAHANLTEQDIGEMEEVFGYMEEAARARNFIEYARYHVYLHEIFISASKNDMLIVLLHNLRMHTLWHRYTHKYYKQDFENSLKIHRRIIDLLKEKNSSPEEIEKVVREHIEIALKPFLSTMKELESIIRDE